MRIRLRLLPVVALLLASAPLWASNTKRRAVAVGHGPGGKPAIVSFTAAPATINPGGTSTLSWVVNGASTTAIDQGIGTLAGSSVVVSPSATTTYTLTATNAAGSVTAATTVTVQSSQEIVYDCTPSSACMQLTVNGDPVDTNTAFWGNLDPSIRRDPNGSHTLWLLYSFPLIIPGGTPSIEIHLASSTDHGGTWNYAGNVWPYAKQADGNYSAHEVSSLAPQTVNGTTTWYAIHHYYEVPPGGSAANPNRALYVEPVFTQSTYYVLVKAASPPQLSNPQESAILVCGGTTSAYASLSNPNLTTLAGDPNAVTWREPALIVQGNTLYLAIQAANAKGLFSYIGVFAAQTTGPMSTWQWRYLGKLLQPSDAAPAIPNVAQPVFTEIDLTQKSNGQILAIMTAMDAATGVKYGSRTADVATLGTYEPPSPPAMVRDGNGHLVLTGQFTASDLNVAPNQGPGASTYEAMETGVGVLIARRMMQPNTHGFTFSTGQHPQ